MPDQKDINLFAFSDRNLAEHILRRIEDTERQIGNTENTKIKRRLKARLKVQKEAISRLMRVNQANTPQFYFSRNPKFVETEELPAVEIVEV